ncbi:putative small nuclear ribonucleoparticle-associated protein [Cavenderia fasciculata]|uniref:Small nuclear ribonucleoparticle-associated protein n=1 Tax=Cavenderia fasciculata TaxID=261658 RepID=F4PHL6_CACFS|nr:putative small nuclear ribonucleoparticle-associated protein [Cavenderia fasciculata]EGG25200.1 putative small nuclear ribonucleoparticle-associated protein [Cavenderia fasciculata]|eukprot:XP_004363051.1 putative small nuclear ribonucleoparticle-associated protein [Cavenderia fasciculata]
MVARKSAPSSAPSQPNQQQQQPSSSSSSLVDPNEEQLKKKEQDKKEEKDKHRVLKNMASRGAKTIRGHCTGYIIGFDKHFNVILKDVDEEYSIIDHYSSNNNNNNNNQRNKVRVKRHYGQLFIKGDSIVSIGTLTMTTTTATMTKQQQQIDPPPLTTISQ